MAAAVARHVGARHVVITDVNPYRLDLALKMGATRAVDVSKEKLKDVMTELGISTLSDVQRLEETPLVAPDLPGSIYQAIELGAESADGRDALVFLPDPMQPDMAFRWSYEDLLRDIRRAASGFLALADGFRPVVSLLLPNLPETHFALWGGSNGGRGQPD